MQNLMTFLNLTQIMKSELVTQMQVTQTTKGKCKDFIHKTKFTILASALEHEVVHFLPNSLESSAMAFLITTYNSETV